MNAKRTTLTIATIMTLVALVLTACGAVQPASDEAPVVLTAQAQASEIAANFTATAIIANAYGATPIPPMPQNVYDATPTGAPAISNGPTATPNSPIWECYYSGARMADGHVPDAERFGGAGRCDINSLINSVSMQAFWEEVVNNDTQLPVGLERTDVATGTLEANNDFVYVFAIRHGGPMLYFVADSTESASSFPFWWTSCVQYNVDTQVMTFYKDDSGKPGGFDGSCTGVWKEFGGKTADKFSGEVMTYIQAIETLAAKGYKTPNQPYVLDIVWFEVWPK